MYTLKHNRIQATINPIGAELGSLKVEGVEYLWQGDKVYWSGRAPILFPIVGALKDGCMSYQGYTYKMAKHGIARQARFECLSITPASISMRLQADSISLQQYPWHFELRVHFTLNDSGLDIRYEIVNRDDSPMLFTIGSHPAFALNAKTPAQLAEYTITINQKEPLQRYKLHESGLLDTTAEPYHNVIPLSETLFNDDALVFRDIEAETITLSQHGQTVLTVDTGGAPHLGIWSKPGAPFVCIEPWQGTCDFTDSDNRFENKPDLTTLAPGDRYEHGIGIVFPTGEQGFQHRSTIE